MVLTDVRGISSGFSIVSRRLLQCRGGLPRHSDPRDFRASIVRPRLRQRSSFDATANTHVVTLSRSQATSNRRWTGSEKVSVSADVRHVTGRTCEIDQFKCRHLTGEILRHLPSSFSGCNDEFFNCGRRSATEPIFHVFCLRSEPFNNAVETNYIALAVLRLFATVNTSANGFVMGVCRQRCSLSLRYYTEPSSVKICRVFSATRRTTGQYDRRRRRITPLFVASRHGACSRRCDCYKGRRLLSLQPWKRDTPSHLAPMPNRRTLTTAEHDACLAEKMS